MMTGSGWIDTGSGLGLLGKGQKSEFAVTPERKRLWPSYLGFWKSVLEGIFVNFLRFFGRLWSNHGSGITRQGPKAWVRCNSWTKGRRTFLFGILKEPIFVNFFKFFEIFWKSLSGSKKWRICYSFAPLSPSQSLPCACLAALPSPSAVVPLCPSPSVPLPRPCSLSPPPHLGERVRWACDGLIYIYIYI